MKTWLRQEIYWMRLYISYLLPVIRRTIYSCLRYGIWYNPLAIYTVDPKKIQHVHKYYRESLDATHIGEIRDGNWDDEKYYEAFDNLLLVRAVKDTIFKGMPFSQSEHCAWQLKDIERSRRDPNRRSRPLRSMENFLQREKIIKSLYKNMRTHGYQTQKELSHENMWRKLYGVLCHEVTVAVGRHGQLFFADGQHRFLLSRILGIPIQVKVSVVHAQWVLEMKKQSNSSLFNLNKALQGLFEKKYG